MDFKDYFDIPNGITYLNTPGNGLLPITSHVWRSGWENDFFDPEGDLRDQQSTFIKAVKEDFASLFHCATDRLYLVPSFSFGYNTLLEGLDKRCKFLLLADEYPSLNYPVISRGFAHHILAISPQIEDDIYLHILSHKPDVLALSIVNYINGLQINLDFIKRLKSEFPNLLIIGDATQYLGSEPFYFDNSGFDALGGSGYKWLMSGFGNGYMMISEKMSELLYKDAKGKDRPPEAMWSHKTILDIYFEPGHQDTLSHGTLQQAVLFLQKIGLNNVKSYLDDLVNYAYRIFGDRNWLLPLIADRKERSALINLQIDPAWYPYLLANGIKCFPRGTGIRIGIHLYNTIEDINRLVEVIERKENEYKNR
ncbi:aminotransferase class V-fold PLP-dependent enzyme [Sphingobacterium rhinopitheci]|uniref:aminotransferase class V-fold PLP-dependent enzyme n=1 Tax=Sphingobacterium rhinopitheci TaxID=2781960 RepID=UPI001F520517|nr:aminotransferase class V-fold PLP-dependent enzyme [Sphingobacterium rhinopitheci]MCI0922184.1 aminotransferase class V-fold PLP-dependent enzyme [Sphingobacterium rhinopitheci]